jgi:hypothetical protein
MLFMHVPPAIGVLGGQPGGLVLPPDPPTPLLPPTLIPPPTPTVTLLSPPTPTLVLLPPTLLLPPTAEPTLELLLVLLLVLLLPPAPVTMPLVSVLHADCARARPATARPTKMKRFTGSS